MQDANIHIHFQYDIDTRALITGITGQDGAYLAHFLLEKGYRVFGLTRNTKTQALWRLDALGITDRVILIPGDITNVQSLEHAIKIADPHEVYNLAALSSVQQCWKDPHSTQHTNATGAAQVLESVKLHAPHARFFQASSSEMFGKNTDDTQNESTPFQPCSPYAIAKLDAHWTTINYRETFGVFACAGIFFNHESPLRSLEYVTRKISDGVARIHLGMSEHITLGNLDIKRDWGFAQDYVAAMWKILQHDQPDEFVIATGQSHALRTFIEMSFGVIGIHDWQHYIQTDDKYMRPNDLKGLCGDSTKAKTILGWQPSFALADIATMMVEADIHRLQHSLYTKDLIVSAR